MLRRLRRRAYRRQRGQLTLEGLPFSSGQVGTTIHTEPRSTTVLAPESPLMRASLISVLAGLDPADSGRVLVDGVDISSVSLTQAKRLVGLVLADPLIVSGTIADNIVFGLEGFRPKDVISAAKLAGIVHNGDDPIRALTTDVGLQGEDLPLGLRRRVGLARVLLRKPSVVVADEPADGLAGEELFHTVSALREVGTAHTLVVVSSTAEFYDHATRIVSFAPATGETSPNPQHKLPATIVARRASKAVLVPANPVSPNQAEAPAVLKGKRHGLTPLKEAKPHRSGANCEIAPGYMLTGLHQRSEHIDTWLAWSQKQNQLVKVDTARHHPPSDQARQIITVHYLRANTFSHPALSHTLDVDVNRTEPYAVFSYLGGTTLDLQFTRRIYGSDPRRILLIGCQLADALDHIHNTGYALLNLHPENVTEHRGRVGIESLAMAAPLGSVVEPPMAPRQRQFAAPEWESAAPLTAKLDIYSLGMLLRSGISQADHGESPEQKRQPVSADVHTFLGQLTASDPNDRPDAAEALAAMRTLAGVNTPFASGQVKVKIKRGSDLAFS